MSVFLSQKWMENKLSFFYSAVWGKGRREEGARTRMHVSISCAEHHESNQVGFFEPQDHEVHGNCILLGEGTERQYLSKTSPVIPFLWLPTALTMGVYSSETKYNFFKGANFWLLYRLFGMKTGAVVWALQRCRFLGGALLCLHQNMLLRQFECLVMLFCSTQA